MEAGTILRDGGAVNGIQRGLAPLDRQKTRQNSKMIRLVCEAGAHIGIGIETGIDIVARSPPPGMPCLESNNESPSW
jgi:hypothetical protein